MIARRPLGLAAAVLVAGALAACGSGADVSVTGATTSNSPGPSTASRSTEPGRSTPTTSLPAYLQHVTVGDCVDNIGDKWVGDDCSKGHDFEVSAVVDSKWDKRDVLERSALRTWTCDNVAAPYLGGPIMATFFNAMPLPAAEDPRSDQRIVCLTFQSGAGDGRVVQTFSRMRGQLSDPAKLAKYRTCLTRATTANGSVETVPCSAEHAAEGVTTVSLGNATAPYPGTAQIRARARKTCAPKIRSFLGGVQRSDLVVGALASGERQWDSGHRTASCFVNVKGAPVTMSVRNIKHASLKAYR